MRNTGKELKVIYEDRWLVVVEKPCGMLSMSTGKSGELTAYSILRDHYDRIFIVHRLDRETSGILVFARDYDTKMALQENWNEAVLERKYIAILEGEIDSDEGWIETWLHENEQSKMVHCHEFTSGDDKDNPPRRGWQFASSHCKTLKRGDIDCRHYTAVEFNLETGRKNQIRVHSQWIGHPVAGDRKYGASTNPIGRLALHAHILKFIHPWTGKTMSFSAPQPKSFGKLKERPVLK